MDSDCMKDSGRDMPFSPPPEKPTVGWLGKILIFLAVVYLGVKLVHWLDNSAQPKPKQTVEAAASAAKLQALQQNPKPSPPQTQSDRPRGASTRTSTVITKCIVQGKVSYGDVSCPAGAITSMVATKADENLMAAVKVSAPEQVIAPMPPAPVMAQVNPVPDHLPMKAECAALEARIKNLDSLARQPQSAQTQDWIREERKKARDRQVRIPCS